MNKDLQNILQDIKKFSDIDKETELCYARNEEPTQEMLDKYCESTELAMKLLEKYDKDLYEDYCNKGTIGNELYLFAEVIEHILSIDMPKLVAEYLDWQYEIAQNMLEEAIDDRNVEFVQKYSKDIHLLEQVRELNETVLANRFEDYKGEDY